MSGGPEHVDPVAFCAGQVQSLRLALDALSTEVRRLGNAIDDMRAEMVEHMDEGATKALARLSHDSDHGRPYWTAGADHIGRRWYDTGTRFLGNWLVKLVGGAALVAALVWYVGGLRK